MCHRWISCHILWLLCIQLILKVSGFPFPDEDMEKEKEKIMMAPAPVPRIVIKHSVLGSRAMNQYVSSVSHCARCSIYSVEGKDIKLLA